MTARLVRTELLKLRTRSSMSLLLLMAVLGLLGAVRVARSTGSAGGIHPGTPDAWLQVLGAGMAPAVLVLLVGVLSFTGESRHGSLTPTLLVTPRRERVVLAKIAACALVGSAIAAALALVATAVGLQAGALSGAPGGHTLRVLGGAVLLAAIWGWFGVALGVLVRHQIPALVLPLVWFLVVETLVTSFGLDSLRWWLPGGAGSGLTAARGALPAWLALLVLIAYGSALTVPGTLRLVRADIS